MRDRGGGYHSIFLATIDQSQRIFMRYQMELPRYQRLTERFIGSVGNGTDETNIYKLSPSFAHPSLAFDFLIRRGLPRFKHTV